MDSKALYFPNALYETGSLKTQPGLTWNASEWPVDERSSDEQLLLQIQGGSSEALARLFRRYARAVRDVAYRILRDEGEADDLVQDVFLFIFRKASLYSAARGKAASWIIHVAYHRAFDRRRYLKTRQFYAKQDLNDSRAAHLGDLRKQIPLHDRSIEGTLGREVAGRMTSYLTAEQQVTIQLFFFEGYTLKEIAGLTGRSLVNVRSYYYRGLERLRKFILSEKIRSK
jgi:RNA polymerase sigma-70 factor, ECF subfamily